MDINILISSMSISSKELIYYFKDEINNARKNPSNLITHLVNRKFINNTFQFAHCLIPNVHYRTVQGPSAVQQAILYLNKAISLPQLTLSGELCEAAYQLGLQISRSTLINPQHYSTKVDVQLTRLGVKNYGSSEVIIEYGFRKDPQLVPSIIISDGDNTRFNRNLLMSPTAKYLGISVHQHPQYDYMVVILINDILVPKRCNCSIF